jgi:hypothetical protein
VDAHGYGGAASALLGGNELAAQHYGTLTQKLVGCAGMAGDDVTSQEFARQYDAAAQEAVDGLDDLVDAFGSLASLVRRSHAHHRRANAAAAYGHPAADPDDPGFEPGTVDVGSVRLPTALGANDADLPQFWEQVLDHLEGYAWPNADTGRLRDAATSWWSAADDVERLVSGCDSAVARLETQQSPEIPLATRAVGDLRDVVVGLAVELRGVGDSCEEYAAVVEEHRAIVRGILTEMAVEAGLTVVAGAVVGFVTLGGGAAAGTALAGWRIASAAKKVLTTLRALHELARARAVARLTSVVERIGPLRSVLARLKRARRLRADASRLMCRTDLNDAQLSNLSRYTKKLPAGAESTVITRGSDGAIHLSTKVPGRVPGSYAIYEKVVDASGRTIAYTKTTVAPDGSVLHIKHKLVP